MRHALVWIVPVLTACGHGAAKAPPAPTATELAAQAEAFYDGKHGHPLDHVKSAAFAKQACDGGSAHGCMFLGLAYQDGLGIDFDPAAAIAAYTKACAGGSGAGCFNLGTMYSGGHGVVSDPAAAKQWLAKATTAWNTACQGSEPRWCTNAAFMIAHEHEPNADERSQMLALYQRACDHDVLVGCTEVVREKINAKQLAGAATIRAQLEPICAKGESGACTLAAVWMLQDATDAPSGLAMLQRACDEGDKVACSMYAEEAERGELMTKDLAGAEKHYELACDRGFGRACHRLALAHGTEPDVSAGYATRGCHMGEAASCSLRAQLAFEGHGPDPSVAEGLRWATLACEMGDGPACGPLVESGVELPVPAEMRVEILAHLCQAGLGKACSGGTAMACDILHDEAQLAACVGKTVTLQGVVENAKIATLLGVDVEAPDSVRGQEATATGRLERYTIDPPKPGEPIAASRGPGTYWRLVAVDGKGLAVPTKL